MVGYCLKTTDELKVGDIVWCHGADFRITSMRESEAHRVYTVNVALPVLVCSTECLNPEDFHGPKEWTRKWTIQGNSRARWAVKMMEAAK